MALRDALSIVEQDPKHQLAFGLAALAGAQQPLRGLAVIGAHAHAAMVHEPNTSLRPRLALLGEWPPDIQGRRVVAGIEGRETMTKIILVGSRARGPSKGADDQASQDGEQRKVFSHHTMLSQHDSLVHVR